MAQLLHSTRFKSPSTAVSSFNVTIPATAVGSKLVCVSGGGAIVTAKLGIGGTSFTKRTTSLSAREVAAQDITDSGGGTTTIQITLNGPENVDGMIFEFASGTLGNFIAGANQGGGSANTDSQGQASTGSVATSGASVLFAAFTAGDSSSAAGRNFWGFEPVGKQYANEYINNDTSKLKYWSMIGLSDQASAGTFTAVSSRILTNQEHQSVLWAYTNLDTGTPTYVDPYANSIARENSKPGSLNSAWFGITTSGGVAGYTDSLSYQPGDTVNFKVDSNNAAFQVEVVRLGFYGYYSFGGKIVTTVTGSPAVQGSPSIDSFGGSVCSWSTTASWSIPSTATPGIYAYNMRRTDDTTQKAQGIFVVRSTPPSSQANKIMLKTADFTWQAYNVWGARTDSGNGYSGFTGRGLYGLAPTVAIGTRAFAVSYDRPWGTISANSQTFYWDSEAGLVNFLEGNGYDIDYYAMADIDKDSTIPSKYKIAISSGHDEYWTANVRDAFENARDAGTSLIFLSSNTSLWHVRFDSGDTNRRTMICYKDSHNTTGYDNTTKFDPTSYTGTWRDARTVGGGVNNTARRPESGMTGQWFVGNGTFSERIAVPNTYRSSPLWRNTRVASAATISVRATNSNVITTAGTTASIDQPSSTAIGDLLLIALVFNSSNPGFTGNGMRVVRLRTDSNGQTTAILQAYAITAGTATFNFSWSNSCMVAMTMIVYANAVWEDSLTSVLVDSAGGTTHTTRSISNGGANRWAVCAFGDSTSSGSSKTTAWTAGTGLTSRVTANNSAAASGPWCSVAIMDTNGAVSAGAHQYSADAEFGNTRAAAGIMYISPGYTLQEGTIGAEWDYVKREEPSTPTNMVMLSRQPLPVLNQASDYGGSIYTLNGLFYYGLSLYKAASGALVFNAGTWQYQFGLSRFRAATFLTSGPVDVAMQQSIINIIGDMGLQPTTLLDVTANNDATALVGPGSVTPPANYGFDVASTTYQNIFTATTVPQSMDLSDGVDYTLGTLFSASKAGKVHGIRWYFPQTIPDAPVIGVLYSWTNNTTGTELARVTFGNVQTGWNEALFTSPIDTTANTKYFAAVWTSDRYVSITSQFTSAAVTNGDLTAPQDVSGAHNAQRTASAGSPAFPATSVSGTGYLADVLFVGTTTVSFEGWGIPLS